MEYKTARAYAATCANRTPDELEAAFDALVAERDAAQGAIGWIMAERSRRRDAELQELRAAAAKART